MLKAGHTGMTLPELLVTLTLLSLLTTLTLGGLDFVRRSTEKIKTHHAQQQQDQRLHNSLGSLLSQLQITHNTPLQDFKGTATQWNGTSLSPPGLSPGQPTTFSLQLETAQGETGLYYRSTLITDTGTIQNLFASEQNPTSTGGKLASWPEETAPRFRYLDHDNTWQDNWQGKAAEPGKLPVLLPRAICLCSSVRPPYLFSIPGRKTRPPKPLSVHHLLNNLP